MDNYRQKLAQITTFVFDFDGVLSDGKIWVLPDGDQVRATNAKDGYAIQYALKKGFRVIIISGGTSETMRLRYKHFKGIEIHLQVSDKLKVFNDCMREHQITPEEVLIMGDDIPDYQIMSLCGIKCCPADAAEEIKQIADYISYKKGGEGCVRDVMEQVLKAQDKWFENDAAFLW